MYNTFVLATTGGFIYEVSRQIYNIKVLKKRNQLPDFEIEDILNYGFIIGAFIGYYFDLR